MDTGNRQGHWQRTYQAKTEQEVSWHQDSPEPSLTLVAAVAASPDTSIIDIGGGSSHLVDHLLRRGYRKLTVLDLSSAALARAQARIGAEAPAVDWIAADVTAWTPAHRYEVWHDRAAFHFMVTEADRSAYLACLRQALVPGGFAIIATFAPDGPDRCSGLPVLRYDSPTLAAVLEQDFTLIRSERQLHRTPWNAVQPFQFSVFRRRAETP